MNGITIKEMADALGISYPSMCRRITTPRFIATVRPVSETPRARTWNRKDFTDGYLPFELQLKALNKGGKR